MLEALYAEPLLDALWRITDWAYSQQTDLLLRGATGITELLSSESGTRQGDPLAMLLFCLSTKAPMRATIAEVGPVVTVSVADDITFLGPLDGELATKAGLKFKQDAML